MNEVSVFQTQVPAHALNPQSKAMQAMAGGLSGNFGNRLSLRNSKFRFIKAGSELPPITDPTLEVVIFALSDSVQRLYYAGEYSDASKDRPTCYSMDGKVPMADSPEVQSTSCAICPQNVRGSGRKGDSKACAYKKRVIVVSPYDITGDAYALDVNGMSMFGEQIESQNLFSFKGYFEKLSVHNADIAAMVTQLSFDDAASVPKLHFKPIRWLTAEEYALVQRRADDDDVQLMLQDMTNEMETNGPEPAPVQEPPKPVIAPRQPRVASMATRAAVAPARVATPVAPAPAVHGVGGLQSSAAPKGFPRGSARIVNPAPAVAAPQKGGVQIDLSSIIDFDDEKTQ